jgi:hypothetical protein
VDLTARLVAALGAASRRPRVLVSGSAVGFYGASDPRTVSEDSPAGSDFLAGICRDWEAAALRAEALGLRVVLLRTGVVLGLDGGALVSMLPAFRAGLGGRIGSGHQSLPWIHVHDWVRIACAALADERYRGPFNAVAPEPVSNREFTRALAGALDRPAPFPVPGFVLRVLFGGGAQVLLTGQRALPARLGQLGFVPAFPRLAQALGHLLRDDRPELAALPPAAGRADSPYLAARTPTHRLEARTELAVPQREAFAFFSDPDNLGLLTPRALGVTIHARSGPPAAGATVDHRIRVGPLRLSWRTRFEAWTPPGRFVDVQERGPYRAWWHEHRFEERGGVTAMHDRVLYAMRCGLLGRLAHRWFVAHALGDAFRQRAIAIRMRFGDPRGGPP